ncbi:MAG: tRNA-dihydrouridine synthase, partial [Simkaniaceae bacterium]|nr:tRNA-dihydrouridine synthase [Simkaniaceae bacterium]
VAAVSIPVTVKIRTGWDEASINAPLITQIAESAGAKAITVHGRTRVQGYKGNADWGLIKQCVDVAKTIKVIGNGDVTSGPLAEQLFTETGCDAILVSRATMGTPWIVEDILRHFEGKSPLIMSHKQIMLDHLGYTKDYEDERGAVIAMRRVGCWYLRKGKGTKALRETINRAQSLKEIEKLIANYDWEGVSYDSI